MKGRTRAPAQSRKEHTMTTNLYQSATSFDVIVRGKVVATFTAYADAWAYARKYRTAVVRYFVKK